MDNCKPPFAASCIIYFQTIPYHLLRMKRLGSRNGQVSLYLQQPNMNWKGAYLVGKDHTYYLHNQKIMKFVLIGSLKNCEQY